MRNTSADHDFHIIQRNLNHQEQLSYCGHVMARMTQDPNRCWPSAIHLHKGAIHKGCVVRYLKAHHDSQPEDREQPAHTVYRRCENCTRKDYCGFNTLLKSWICRNCWPDVWHPATRA